MAVTSPVLVQTESSNLKLTASKAKSLAVRPNTKGDALDQRSPAPVEAGPEIAEQMNEEIKQRYVKGKPNFKLQASKAFLLTLSR